MLKVTKCIGVKFFVEALINMVCELKITSGSKENCVKIPWSSDTQLIVISEKQGNGAVEIHSRLYIPN